MRAAKASSRSTKRTQNMIPLEMYRMMTPEQKAEAQAVTMMLLDIVKEIKNEEQDGIIPDSELDVEKKREKAHLQPNPNEPLLPNVQACYDVLIKWTRKLADEGLLTSRTEATEDLTQ